MLKRKIVPRCETKGNGGAVHPPQIFYKIGIFRKVIAYTYKV